MKPCLHCQKDYEFKRAASKFCSDKCRVAYNRRHPKQGAVTPMQVQVLYNAVLEMVGNMKQGGQVVAAVQKTAFQSPLAQQPIPRVAQDAIMRKYVEDRRNCTCESEFISWSEKLDADTRITDSQKELVKTTH